MNAHQFSEWSRLCSQLERTRCVEKEPDAEALLKRAVNAQPDAVYLLAKRTLLLERALTDAAEEVTTLQRRLREQHRHTSAGFDVGTRLTGQMTQGSPAPVSRAPYLYSSSRQLQTD